MLRVVFGSFATGTPVSTGLDHYLESAYRFKLKTHVISSQHLSCFVAHCRTCSSSSFIAQS